MYMSILYMRKVTRKTDIFASYVEKIKKCIVKSFFLAPFVVFLHTTQKVSVDHL
jgi:hypothetical protein